MLSVKCAERKDTGPYTLRLKNDAGVVEGKVNVIVLGKGILCLRFSSGFYFASVGILNRNLDLACI